MVFHGNFTNLVLKIKKNKKNDYFFNTKFYKIKMCLEQLLIAEIEKRKNRKNDKDVFVELENRVKKDAIKERLKSRMEMYMLCRCF